MPVSDDSPTDSEVACFEAGIKFGSLYHQFAGTPVSPESAPSLATAMEDAIANQPYCESVTVEILTDAIDDAIADGQTYTELTGKFLEVEIVVVYDGTEVLTEMAMEDGYPLMQVTSVARD